MGDGDGDGTPRYPGKPAGRDPRGGVAQREYGRRLGPGLAGRSLSWPWQLAHDGRQQLGHRRSLPHTLSSPRRSHRRACSPCHLSSELRVLPGATPTRQRSTPTPGPGLLPPDLLTSVGAPIPHGVQVPRPLLPPCVLRASGNHLPGLLLTAPSSELPRATSSDSGMRRAPPAPLRPSCHLALSGPRHHDRFGLAPSPPAAPHSPPCARPSRRVPASLAGMT